MYLSIINSFALCHHHLDDPIQSQLYLCLALCTRKFILIHYAKLILQDHQSVTH